MCGNACVDYVLVALGWALYIIDLVFGVRALVCTLMFVDVYVCVLGWGYVD